MTNLAIDDALMVLLLELADRHAQVATLRERGLLTEEGLEQLLDRAMNLARSDLDQARRLATVCEHAAQSAAVTALLPRVAYLRAQIHAFSGELSEALAMISSAHDQYLALEEVLPAMRTNVGRMHVLSELGRHQEALAVGEQTLAQLAQLDDSPKVATVAALIQHNRAICLRRVGQYDAALEALDAAERLYLQVGMEEQLGDLRNNRGLILLNLGRAGDALAAFEAATATAAEAGRRLLQMETLINRGEAHLLLGNYTRSLEALEEARRLSAEVSAPANEIFVDLHRADVYQALNLYPEALTDYRAAASAFEAAGMSYYQARSLWGMGAALLSLGQFEQAARAFDGAAGLFADANNVPLLCSVRLEQAALEAARGRDDAALALARSGLALVEGDSGWPVQQVYAHMRLADLLLPDVATAEHHLLQAQSLSASLVFPQLQYRLIQRLGHLRRLQGRSQEAVEFLEAAIDGIEQMRGTVVHESMRVSFLHDKVTAYEDLLRLYLESGDETGAARAFAVAEQARSRSLVDLLAGVASAAPAPGSDVGDQLGELQAELNAVYNELLGSGRDGDGVEAPARAQLLLRAQMLEQQIQRLRLRSGLSGGSSDPFRALPLDEILSGLPRDTLLLTYQVVGDEILIFVREGTRLESVISPASVTTVRRLVQRLNVQWDRFRAGQEFARRHMALLERSAQRVLHGLYQALIAPVEHYLGAETSERPQSVTVIPHDVLHQVPFHALFDGEQYLLERLEIAYAPSATVLTLCAHRPAPGAGRALIAGVADRAIPAVQTEVAAVARRLPESDVRLDDEATVTAVVDEAPAYNILHLACHGLFRADNPMFSALKLADGWLTAADVLQIELDNALVTLSACESGRGTVLGADEVIGLARAFLGAGAVSLLVSLWLVQDETTARLMEDWYGRLQEQQFQNRAAALRAAQRALKDNFSHPYYWAPFILIGQR
ncbi:MAG: CHAT domain-containing protein [Candidatus Promineifilaceae bacterium]|nr:CHAT domain-containing protein [Candidatus Promineifilaceae bacterium]